MKKTNREKQAKQVKVAASAPVSRSPDWICYSHDPSRIARRVKDWALQNQFEIHTLIDCKTDAVISVHTPRTEVGGITSRPKIYISAGIHGDEPASIEGLLRWLESNSPYLKQFDFTIVPCLNPKGLRLNTRCDPETRDLNRCFNREGVAVLAALKRYLTARGPFSLALLLHEDYDSCGVYLYELALDPGWGDQILKSMSAHCPIDFRSCIDEHWMAKNGVIFREHQARWFSEEFLTAMGMAEAPYLFLEQSSRIFTIETPSEFDISLRSEAHKAGIEAALCLLAACEER